VWGDGSRVVRVVFLASAGAVERGTANRSGGIDGTLIFGGFQ